MLTVAILCAVVWIAGQILPWFQLRSRGLSLSAREYISPMIKRSIFSLHYNPYVFDTLLLIQQNKLDVSFFELEHMYQANIDFRNVIDAMLLAKKRNVKVSKTVLRDLAERRKDLLEIILAKKPGQELFYEEAFASSKVKGPSIIRAY